jgi:hypothetical protein
MYTYVYTGGATLKKLETDNDVKIDIMRIRGLVRIRGTVSTCEAVENIFLKFIDEVKITIIIDISELSSTNNVLTSDDVSKDLLDDKLDAKKNLEKNLVSGSENGKKNLKKNLNEKKNSKKSLNEKKNEIKKITKNGKIDENIENNKNIVNDGIEECYESKGEIIDSVNPEILRNEKNMKNGKMNFKSEKILDDVISNVINLFQIEVLRDKNVLTLKGVSHIPFCLCNYSYYRNVCMYLHRYIYLYTEVYIHIHVYTHSYAGVSLGYGG